MRTFRAFFAAAGLSPIVMTSQRAGNVVWDNKEGLASALGYAALACIGAGVGWLLRCAVVGCHLPPRK